MKTQIFAAICLFPVLCHAENPPATKPKGLAKLEMAGRKIEKAMDRMPEELKERFKSAREGAMKTPRVIELQKKVQEAAKELQDAVREEMQKIDPDLQESMKGLFKGEKGGSRGVWNLSSGEKEQLEAARKKAHESPAVTAAQEQMKEAKTAEEREAARDNFQKAMRTAVLEIDPSLEKVLDKIKPPKNGGHGPMPPKRE